MSRRFYEPVYREDGTLEEMRIREGSAPRRRCASVWWRIWIGAYFPVKTIIPSTEIVHDRVMLELFRGCIRGCRFCQVGFCYRPVRPKSPERLYELAVKSLENSGYDEMTLSSLSTSDYKKLGEFADQMLDYCIPRGINLSLPSAAGRILPWSLMQKVQKVR